ncbi:MAG TPA: hypothetical protein VGO40_09350 [Longimicrobium sp.]|jgi:hypothetical protein|nr:hypothetical protein [Longimicrobium sp.]
MQKLTLNLDELQVEGFETATTSAWIDATVLGDDLEAATTPCTEKRSCGHICP